MKPIRPTFKDKDVNPNKKNRLIVGTKDHGVFIDVTKEGLKINAYYTSFDDEEMKYAVLSDGVFIDWEQLEKIIKNKGLNKKRKKINEPDRIERKVDKAYLENLPIVTLNNDKYYIDMENGERRPVNNPERVWKFA